MRTVAPGPALVAELRKQPFGTMFEIREREGALVFSATFHEAEILNFNGSVEAVCNRCRLKYLRLRVSAKVAVTRLRRMLSSAPHLSEASQLTIKQNVAGGVVYSHFNRRTNGFKSSRRREFYRTVTA
jgi:hypothetical protein